MIIIKALDDPIWWPFINWMRIVSYFIVASSAALVYDWALSFAQELELVWRRHWSLMTVLYICVRYLGILFSIVDILWSFPPVSTTDAGCTIIYFIRSLIPIVVNAMLGVIMMTRIHAMYQRSKKMFNLLLVVLLACSIASAVMALMANIGVSGEKLVISSNHLCADVIDTEGIRLTDETLIPTVVWEIIVLFLAAYIVIKHFCELQRSPRGSIIEDCFTVLTRGHALYFAVFAAVSCFTLVSLSPNIMYSNSVGNAMYNGVLQSAQFMQMFVLGPRLILSIREYHAKLVASSDEGPGITTIDFQVRRHASTSGSE